MKKTIAATTAALALAFGPAAPAHADPGTELSYLQEVTQMGFQVYDTARAINTGYAICGALETTPGEQVAYNLFMNTSWSDLSSMASARLWVIAAADTLCPWTWNPQGRQLV